MRKNVAWDWIAALCLLMGGCTNTIIPPKLVEKPATVYLLDHGRHPSLVMPGEQGLVRYAYGEWNWYALGNTGVLQAFSALFLPTPAALGQKPLGGEEQMQQLLRHEPTTRVYAIAVEQNRVAELRQRLDSVFARDSQHHFNRDYDLEFVHYPRSYTLFRNSNHMTADWLRELGCKVRGTTMFCEWRVRQP